MRYMPSLGRNAPSSCNTSVRVRRALWDGCAQFYSAIDQLWADRVLQITQPFELYVALSPRLPKSAAVGAANAIARWIQKEEKQVFLRDAPVF